MADFSDDDGQWEVVKSRRPRDRATAKDRARRQAEEMTAPPLDEIKPYEALDAIQEREARKAAKKAAKAAGILPNAQSAQPIDPIQLKKQQIGEHKRKQKALAQQQKGQQSSKETPSKPQSLQHLCTTMSVEALKKYMNEISERYRNAPDAQLQYIADYYLNHFAGCAAESFQMPDGLRESIEYPLSVLKKHNTTVADTTFIHIQSQSSAASAELCFSILQVLAREPQKPHVGLRLLLQLLLRACPSAGSVNIFLDALKENRGKPASAAVVEWAASQLLESDPLYALQTVWSQGLLPLVTEEWFPQARILSWPSYCADKLDDLRLVQTEPIIVASFELLQRVRMGELGPQLAAVVESHWDIILKLSVFFSPTSPHKYFEYLLVGAACEDEKIRDSICNECIEALVQDEEVYNKWEEAYILTIAQSSNVIHHMFLIWDSIQSKFSSHHAQYKLKHMIEQFEVYNQMIAEDKIPSAQKLSDRDMVVAGATCQAMLTKLGSDSAWPQILMASGVIIGGVVAAVYFGCNGTETLGGLCPAADSVQTWAKGLVARFV